VSSDLSWKGFRRKLILVYHIILFGGVALRKTMKEYSLVVSLSPPRFEPKPLEYETGGLYRIKAPIYVFSVIFISC
jgi:hypothetical protein